MTKWLAVLAIMALAVPGTQAHASPDPIDVDVYLLADDLDDSYQFYDGFDLQDLYVRESFVDGQDGLTFRMVIYGGAGSVPVAASESIELDIDAAGSTYTFTIASSDGLAWDGDMQVLESGLEQEGGVIEGSLQVFVPLSELGAMIGDTIGPFEWRTYADGDLRDIAPGGRPVPGTAGAQIIDAASEVKTETLTLDGPVGYTKTTVSQHEYHVNVTVENLITTTGQHISLDIPDPNGWTIERTDTNGQAVEPGESPTFGFIATPDADDAPMFSFDVISDLGGRETVMVHPPAHLGTGTAGSSTAETDDAPGEDSPVPLWVMAGAIAVAAALRRRS